MRVLFLLAALSAGCQDWDKFSEHYGIEVDSGHGVDGGSGVDSGHGLDGGTTVGGKALCSTDAGRFCDDFEGSLNNAWSLPPTDGGGTWSLDPNKHVSGAESLHIHMNATTTNQVVNVALVESASFGTPAMAQGFYARVFVWAGNVGGDYALMTSVSNGGSYSGLHVGLDSTELLEVSDWANQQFASGKVYASSMKRLSSTGWSCLEWHVILGTKDATNGGTTVSVDGVPVSSLGFATGLVTYPGDFPLGLLELGLLTGGVSANTPAFDAWFDDFVIADVPIGCTP